MDDVDCSGTYRKLEGSDAAMPCLGALKDREQRGTLVSRDSGGEIRCSLPAWACGRGLRGRIGGGLFMSWGLSCQAHVGMQYTANAALIENLVPDKATAEPFTFQLLSGLTSQYSDTQNHLLALPADVRRFSDPQPFVNGRRRRSARFHAYCRLPRVGLSKPAPHDSPS